MSCNLPSWLASIKANRRRQDIVVRETVLRFLKGCPQYKINRRANDFLNLARHFKKRGCIWNGVKCHQQIHVALLRSGTMSRRSENLHLADSVLLAEVTNREP